MQSLCSLKLEMFITTYIIFIVEVAINNITNLSSLRA